MGAALMEMMRTRGGARPENIIFFDADPRRTSTLADRLGISPAPCGLELARQSDLIVIAVKPFSVREVIEEVKPGLSPEKMLVSIAAGIGTATIEELSGINIPVVRAMPSMSAASGSGATVICPGKYARPGHMKKAEKFFSAAGEVITSEEKLMDAATAVCGSGPAYFFYLAEALEHAAAEEGFSGKDAAVLARCTLIGAASVLRSSGESPEKLRRTVATPGGTTEAALRILEGGFFELVREAVAEARGRASEISRQISTPE